MNVKFTKNATLTVVECVTAQIINEYEGIKNKAPSHIGIHEEKSGKFKQCLS
jgi:hypothetical protein